MIIKTKGIIFRTKKYSETSLIVDVFTRKKGLRSYLISGVRTKKHRVSPSLLQVMSVIDLVVYHRDDKSLTRIKEVKPAVVYQSIPFDIKKGAVGMFMVEIAQKTIRETEENVELFDFIVGFFTHLDQTTSPTYNLHLLFLVQLTKYLGFTPSGTFNETTPLFDMREGVFIRGDPGHIYYLDEDLSRIFDQFLDTQIEHCHEINMRNEQRKVLLRSILKFSRLHIENFPEIYAHEILETVFR